MAAISDDAIGQRLWQDAKAQAIGTARLAGHGADQKQYTPAEEALMFMQEAPGWTVDKELALLAEGKTPEEVGAMKYPQRQKLAESGERVLSKYDQAKYLADMRQKLDPAWKPTPPTGSQPPAPSPLPTPSPEAPPFLAGPPAYPLTPGG